MRSSQYLYKSGDKALNKAMGTLLDENKSAAIPVLQKLILLKEVKNLYSRQSELGSMIEGCAVLGDELASWRNECKTIAKLISTLCEGSSEEYEQGTLDRSSSEADVVMRVCLDDKKFEYLRS
ncbi:hypothetical protein JOM56_007217 [Amanita muscaria]